MTWPVYESSLKSMRKREMKFSWQKENYLANGCKWLENQTRGWSGCHPGSWILETPLCSGNYINWLT